MSTEYDPNYVAEKVFFEVGVKAVLRDNEQNILLLKRSQVLGGKWSLPGGGIDTGETALGAIAREIREELCVDATEFLVAGTLIDWHEDNSQGVIIWYTGKIENQNITLNWEHDEYAWVPATQALEYQLTAHTKKIITEYIAISE